MEKQETTTTYDPTENFVGTGFPLLLALLGGARRQVFKTLLVMLGRLGRVSWNPPAPPQTGDTHSHDES